jgi:hypothetical protein
MQKIHLISSFRECRERFLWRARRQLSNAKGYIITTNTFSLEAERFAEGKPIELIDGNRLIEYIHLAHGKVVKHETASRRCPACGGELVHRFGRYGAFVGCINYPNCTFTQGSATANLESGLINRAKR